MFCMTLKLLQNSTGNARMLPRVSDKQLQLKVSFTFLSEECLSISHCSFPAKQFASEYNYISKVNTNMYWSKHAIGCLNR